MPLVLAVTITGAAVAAVSTAAGCGDDHKPKLDAGIPHDGIVDTPVV